MAVDELYKALEALRPADFADVPISDLSNYLSNVFQQAALITNSLPHLPATDDGKQSSLSSDAAAAVSKPNAARSAKELKSSAARPPPPSEKHTALWKGWGKPLKVSASSNPLGVTVWKMAGHDRHGAWFARRSIHEGMGFNKWKRAMRQEFIISQAVEGGPGAGAVRGIGADKLVVREEVKGVGRLEVWHLSAQFPGPVAPREFLTMLLTTEEAYGQAEGGGRTYMVVSIPVDHEDAPARDGLVRGFYESVEMIREIPVVSSSSGDNSESSADPEANPVEWMMITRSDPGGGIPRFMVERSTPASITADTVKFLDWATKTDDIPDQDVEPEAQNKEVKPSIVQSTEDSNKQSVPNLAATSTTTAPSGSATLPLEQPEENKSGILASIAGAVQNGIEAYAPNPVLEHLPTTLFTASKDTKGTVDDLDDDDDDSSSTTSSADSFESATPYHTAESGSRRRLSASSSSTENPLASKSEASLGVPLAASSPSGVATPDSTSSGKTKHEEKELRKLIDRKKELDRKFAERVERDARKREEIAQRSTREAEKKRSRIEKEERKTADRYAKEIAKIEERQRKEERRLERKQKKEEEKDRVAVMERERDEAVKEQELLKKENDGLKGQVGELQREMTILVREMGRLPGGQEVLKSVEGELGAAPRATSPNSERSRKSKVSIDSRRESLA